MWSSIGSLRESAQRKLTTVKENALAAAQVAQDVLVTAATEESDQPFDNVGDNAAEWEQWPAPAQQQNQNLSNPTPFHHPQSVSDTQSSLWPSFASQPANVEQSFSQDVPPPPASDKITNYDETIPPPPPSDAPVFGEPVPPPPDTPPPDDSHFSAPLAPNLQAVSFSKKRPSRYVVPASDFPVAQSSTVAPQVSAVPPPAQLSDTPEASIFANESENTSREQSGKFPAPDVSENFGPPPDAGATDTDTLAQIKQLQEQVSKLEEMQTSSLAVIDAKNSEIDDLKSKVHVLRDEKSALETFNEESSALNREIIELRDQVADTNDKALQSAEQRKVLEKKLEELRAERDNIHSSREKLLADLDKARKKAIKQSANEASLLEESEADSRRLQAKLIELQNSLDMVSVERDALAEVQPATPSNSEITDAETSAGSDADPKSVQLKTLRKQLKSANSKISKLSVQRNTVMRQRDDAGARLNAAGAEFAKLSAKLKKMSASNAEAQELVVDLQSERDEANRKTEEQEKIISQRDSKIDELTARLSDAQSGLEAAEIARLDAENIIHATKNEAEEQIRQLSEQLENARDDISTLRSSLEKMESENSNVKEKYDGLESKQNETVRELGDAEKNVAYLLDETAGLKEDLEKTKIELDQSRQKESELEHQLSISREEKDNSQHNLEEAQSILETYKTTEANLRTVIQQLETEQDSIVEDKTREVKDKLEESLSKQAELSTELENMTASYTESQKWVESLQSQRDETMKKIQELRSINSKGQTRIDELSTSLTEAQANLQASEAARLNAENNLHSAEEEFELQMRQLMEQLEHAREDITILQDSLEKVETENNSVRDKYNGLKAKQNETMRELEDAEETVAYLQDEITGLKEDAEKTKNELAASRQQESELEQQLIRIRDEKDKSLNKHREIELIMETQKTAEENLQIAIEQLEAEQATIIEEKTRELEDKLAETLKKQKSMAEKVAEANAAINQLALRDEEIQELRTALGRLSDERVELKLELEKSMSRLNTSGSGGVGQLVDRRVIRQLLVNYFRVGTARRRDVLELMSRILMFTEKDLVTVGLKRVNLSERIGSLLQAPELDGNSLPPIGNVSDRWIEFLMKETEEEEDNF